MKTKVHNIHFVVFTLFISSLCLSCEKRGTKISDSKQDTFDKKNESSQIYTADVKTKSVTDDIYYHASTGLYLVPVIDTRLVPYDSGKTCSSTSSFSGYALSILPRSYNEQIEIEQAEGIMVSYIPFGFEPISISPAMASDVCCSSLEDDTRTVPVQTSKGYDSIQKSIGDEKGDGPSSIRIPTLYVEWPIDKPLPNDLDYTIDYYILRGEDTPRILYPSNYHFVIRTNDSILNKYVRLRNLKIQVSYNGLIVTNSNTNSNGYVKVTGNQANDASEPLSYTLTAILSTSKWKITRNTNQTTPIHITLGTVSQYFDSSHPLDTMYINLSSSSTELEIHRALDFYHNSSHELSSSILTTESNYRVSAPTSSNFNKDGETGWDYVNNGSFSFIYNNGLTLAELMGVIYHELGHARKLYAQSGPSGNSEDHYRIHESYACFVGYHMSRKYYSMNGYSFGSGTYIWFNEQHMQYWTTGRYTPLFVDLTDDYNQSSISSSYVSDSISDVPITAIDSLGKVTSTISGFITNTAPMVGVYFTQNQLDSLLLNY